MNGDLCHSNIVIVLTGLSGMVGVVLGSFLGRKIERVKLERRRRERRDDERRL